MTANRKVAHRRLSRRGFLAAASATAGLLAFGRASMARQSTESADSTDSTIPVPADPTKVQGLPFSERGIRSPFVTDAREIFGVPGDNPLNETNGWSLSPLQDFNGIITPSDLHYQVNHGGTAIIDPSQHELVIYGLVDRPMSYSLDDLMRFPSETHIHFLECSGNSFYGYSESTPDLTLQTMHGLTSTSEWTGVPVSTLMQEVGVQPEAVWALAEGSDAAVMSRSIPVEKLWDDALIAWGQNGEAIRPEQGYPFRLLLPGWEGNMNVKWLRRLVFSVEPFQTFEETRDYTDPLADGFARQYTFPMEAKSLITWPSSGQTVAGPGFWVISGIAWSGSGTIERVEVSVDGGENWQEAQLSGLVLPKSHTRFHFPWEWDGRETTIMSRATDDTGYIQPTREELLQVRGEYYLYHFNGIQPWDIAADGTVTNGWAQ